MPFRLWGVHLELCCVPLIQKLVAPFAFWKELNVFARFNPSLFYLSALR